jgi:hypothetical protein
MPSEQPIWYVHDRFEELRLLLEKWGWDPVERGDLSEWDEGRRQDPVMGLVRIRGTRQLSGVEGAVSFTIKEWWARPPVPGVISAQGFVLAGYHYTAQSSARQVRHCFDPIRHPAMPCHRHPYGDERIVGEAPIDVEAALQAFEERLAEDLLHADGTAVSGLLGDDEDHVDDVFGEGE